MAQISNYATIDEVVAYAASQIPHAKREDWQRFRAWAWLAEEKIGPTEFSIKTTNITDISNCSACKPDGHLKTLDMALFAGGTELQWKYNVGKAKMHKFDAFNISDEQEQGGTPSTGGDGETENREIVWVYEDDEFIITDSSSVDCIRLQYYTTPIDKDGNPLIARHHIDAISLFILWRWEMMGNNIAKAGMLRTEWKWAAKKARGQNKMPNMVEGGEIIRRWMSMFQGNHNKYRNE